MYKIKSVKSPSPRTGRQGFEQNRADVQCPDLIIGDSRGTKKPPTKTRGRSKGLAITAKMVHGEQHGCKRSRNCLKLVVVEYQPRRTRWKTNSIFLDFHGFSSVEVLRWRKY